ncbi:hypothetical protein TNCT_367681 [Trichonephila clavata]|uniref:Uncharacterized protein n=1 Tax=Trichonephila clavata TaxID=2740835 RepID=A0A8X6LYZ8_TRICU|nr:hypothetical protein TNCT_367681 [Trichonephila clavata]
MQFKTPPNPNTIYPQTLHKTLQLMLHNVYTNSRGKIHTGTFILDNKAYDGAKVQSPRKRVGLANDIIDELNSINQKRVVYRGAPMEIERQYREELEKKLYINLSYKSF